MQIDQIIDDILQKSSTSITNGGEINNRTGQKNMNIKCIQCFWSEGCEATIKSVTMPASVYVCIIYEQ